VPTCVGGPGTANVCACDWARAGTARTAPSRSRLTSSSPRRHDDLTGDRRQNPPSTKAGAVHRAVRDGPSKASVSVAKVSTYPPEGLQASCKHEVASSSTTAGSTPTTRCRAETWRGAPSRSHTPRREIGRSASGCAHPHWCDAAPFSLLGLTAYGRVPRHSERGTLRTGRRASRRQRRRRAGPAELAPLPASTSGRVVTEPLVRSYDGLEG